MFDVYWNDTAQETVGQRKKHEEPTQDSDRTSNQQSRSSFFKHFHTKRKDPTQNRTRAKITAAKMEESIGSSKRVSGISVGPDLPAQELPAHSQSEPQELPTQMSHSPFPTQYSSYTPCSADTKPSSIFSEGLSTSDIIFERT